MRVVMFLLMITSLLQAEMRFAEPKPSFDTPRKLILPISSGNDEEIHHVLSTANNLLKFYGPEQINIEIVAYYHGIKALLKKNREIATRIDTLMQYDVLFIACGNTMKTKKIDKSELIDDVEIVTAGVAEIIERSLEGWVFIKP